MNTRLLAILLGGSLAWLAAEPAVWARGFGGYGSYATTPGTPPDAYGNFGGSLQASRFAYTSPARANPRLGSFLGVPDEAAVDPATLRLEMLDRYDRTGSDPARGMGGFLEGYGTPFPTPGVLTDVQTEDGLLEPAPDAPPALPSDGGLHLLGNAGPGGPSGGQRDVKSLADADVSGHAALVRRNWRPGGLYSADWYRSFPGAWRPKAPTGLDVWASATWESLATWLDSPPGQPWNFNYGTNIVYRDDAVYVNQTKVATGGEYYQQASSLAATGAAAPDAADQPWLPLGVFSLAHQDQTKPSMIVQLAINKAGVVRGNYTNAAAGETLPLHGSLDKKTQRVAWTIGYNTINVIETGLYNLTGDQAPALLHYGPDRTEQWLLVRLHDKAAEATPAAPERS